MAKEQKENLEISLVVRSRSKTYFKGVAASVSSTNDTGVFDVLPTHANFITLVKDFVTVHLQGGREQKFKIQNGVLRVVGNKVDIYLTV